MTQTTNASVSHTPGPWTTKPNDPWNVYAVKNGHEIVICDIRHAGSQISEANARLVAGAPDLLRLGNALLHYSKHEEPDIYYLNSLLSELEMVIAGIEAQS